MKSASAAAFCGLVDCWALWLFYAEAGPGRAAVSSFLEVGLGILIALVVTVFPPHAKKTPPTESPA